MRIGDMMDVMNGLQVAVLEGPLPAPRRLLLPDSVIFSYT